MIILPIQSEDGKNDAVIVILGPDNLKRMRSGDPMEVVLRQTPFNLVNPTLLVCYEEPTAALTKLVNSGNLVAIIDYLQRGWKFKPEAGDHDRGPEPLGESN